MGSAKSLKKKIEKKKEELRIATQKTTSQEGNMDILAIEKDLKKLQTMKKDAIKKEDYDSAKSIKEEIKNKKEAIRVAKLKATSQGSGANVLALKKDLEKLETMKKNAIMKEDYDSAKSLKKKIEKKKEELRIATQKTTSQGSD